MKPYEFYPIPLQFYVHVGRNEEFFKPHSYTGFKR